MKYELGMPNLQFLIFNNKYDKLSLEYRQKILTKHFAEFLRKGGRYVN